MSTIKEFIEYFLDGLNKTDFVKVIANIVAFFKKYFCKDEPVADTTTSQA